MRKIFLIVFTIILLFFSTYTFTLPAVQTGYAKHDLSEKEIRQLFTEIGGEWIYHELPFMKQKQYSDCEPYYSYIEGYKIEIGSTLNGLQERKQHQRISVSAFHTNDDNYIYSVLSVTQTAENKYEFELEKVSEMLNYKNIEADHSISKMILTLKNEKYKNYNLAQFNFVDLDKDYEFFYKGNDSRSTETLFKNWLSENDYDVDFAWRKLLYPKGRCDADVTIAEAKQIIEDAGLVFETNISEKHWNEHIRFIDDYVVDGVHFKTGNLYGVKKGTIIYLYEF